MKVLVVGCGRVGSAVSLQLRAAGWDVSVIDESEDALGRLGDDWTGEFHVGHGMDIQLLRTAGIEDADAVVVTTDGDNSNIVIGQMAQKNFGVRSVIVRILDPARADFFKTRGLDVVCPTQSAIETLTDAVRAVEGASWPRVRPSRCTSCIAGGGKVGLEPGAGADPRRARGDADRAAARAVRRSSRPSSSTRCTAATRPSSSCSSAPGSSARRTSSSP